jgi:hypothetical protein
MHAHVAILKKIAAKVAVEEEKAKRYTSGK